MSYFEIEAKIKTSLFNSIQSYKKNNRKALWKDKMGNYGLLGVLNDKAKEYDFIFKVFDVYMVTNCNFYAELAYQFHAEKIK